jgi:hypothetical protein
MPAISVAPSNAASVALARGRQRCDGSEVASMNAGPTDFWYVAWSDQREGILIDLIRRPQQAVARVALFRRGQLPEVVRQTFAREALSVTDDGTVTLGPWTLGRDACTGRIDDRDVVVVARFRLEAPEVTMVPAWVGGLFGTLPTLRSTPGMLTALSGCPLASPLPCVLTRYRVGDVARARWFLVSAHGFDGAPDVRLEIAGGRLLGRWVLTGYVHAAGAWWPLNQPLPNLVRFSAKATGEVTGGERRFEVTYRSKRLRFRLDARALVEAFVELEHEGATTIATTLFGDCALDLSVGDDRRAVTSRGCCLLEVKA